MAELVICPRCDRRFDRDMVKDGFAICPYCEEEVEFPVMTREEALERYDRIRYNLLNHDDKVAVDVAFEALREQTNADRIRAMSNDDMAKWLADMFDCHNCSEHERLGDNPLLSDEQCDQECEKHCLDWLKQPYEDGDGK